MHSVVFYKKAIQLLVLIFLPCSFYAQINHECVYVKSVKKKKDIYPFNKATRIEVISYSDRPRLPKTISTDSLIKAGKFIVSNPLDKIILNKAQADSLFSILYNYQVKDSRGVFGADCYVPRHAIVFYKNNKAIAFIEICFECNNVIKTSGVDFGSLCNDKYCILQNFFKYIGVKNEIHDEFCDKNK